METGVLGWLHKNLFSSWFNGALTIFSIYCLWLIVPPIVDWAFLSATWEGSRALLMEIQALVAEGGSNYSRRLAQGLDQNRLVLLLAVLTVVRMMLMTTKSVELNPNPKHTAPTSLPPSLQAAGQDS